MNDSIKNKLLTWLVVFLLLANAGTILFLWMNKPEKSQVPMRSPRDFLVHELELDSNQMGAFQALIEKHQSAARGLKRDIRSAKEDLFQLLKQPRIDEAQKQKTIDAVIIKIQQLELLNLEHFQQVRALCNDKQKKNFDALLDQLAGLMTEPRPPKAGMPAPPSNLDRHHPHQPKGEGHHPPPPDQF